MEDALTKDARVRHNLHLKNASYQQRAAGGHATGKAHRRNISNLEKAKQLLSRLEGDTAVEGTDAQSKEAGSMPRADMRASAKTVLPGADRVPASTPMMHLFSHSQARMRGATHSMQKGAPASTAGAADSTTGAGYESTYQLRAQASQGSAARTAE